MGSYSSSQITRAGLPLTAQGNLGYVNTRDDDRGRDLTMGLLLEGKQENKNAVASGASGPANPQLASLPHGLRPSSSALTNWHKDLWVAQQADSPGKAGGGSAISELLFSTYALSSWCKCR